MKAALAKLMGWWAKVRLPVYVTFFSNHGSEILSWCWVKILKLVPFIRKDSKVDLEKQPEQPNIKVRIPRQVFISDFKLGSFTEQFNKYLKDGYVYVDNSLQIKPTAAVSPDGTPVVIYAATLEHYQAFDNEHKNNFLCLSHKAG